VCVVEPAEHDQLDAIRRGEFCFAGIGTAVNSDEYNGTPTADFKTRIATDLRERGLGQEAVNYKLRDWLFSRQRFWGEPFPILHELDDSGQPTGRLRAVDLSDLPVDLPHLDDYKPHGRPEPPLGKAPDEWLYPVIDGKKYRRETNTMPQWAGSCWYYLRFIDPKNDQQFVDPAKEKAWMPVDLYVGGAEHAVLHLLYARFWHKVLFDRGHVTTPEPFARLINQGMILGEIEFTGYQADDGSFVSANDVTRNADGQQIHAKSLANVSAVNLSADQVEKKGDNFVRIDDPSIRVNSRAHKMSKSRGNVVNPDIIVEEYGADSLRLYEMFMGPLEAPKPWSMAGVKGVRNFLDRVWRMIVDDHSETVTLNASVKNVEPTEEQNRILHKTIKAVTHDFETIGFNTAISRMMEFVNFFTRQTTRPQSAMEQLVLLLAPMAPHIAEELWSILGHEDTLTFETWPSFDEALTQDATVEIPVQVMGKVRGKVTVPTGLSKEDLLAAAKSLDRIQPWLEGKQIVKEIVIPGRLVNFVVR
jgi:leucyl-tRNA synthetase